jgi:hypothetical protein
MPQWKDGVRTGIAGNRIAACRCRALCSPGSGKDGPFWCRSWPRASGMRTGSIPHSEQSRLRLPAPAGTDWPSSDLHAPRAYRGGSRRSEPAGTASESHRECRPPVNPPLFDLGYAFEQATTRWGGAAAVTSTNSDGDDRAGLARGHQYHRHLTAGSDTVGDHGVHLIQAGKAGS